MVDGNAIKKAQQLMKNMCLPWEGHTVAGVLQMLVKEAFGSKGLPRLQPNPEARKVLLAPGIANKAQFGLTEAGQRVKDELDAMVKDGMAVVYGGRLRRLRARAMATPSTTRRSPGTTPAPTTASWTLMRTSVFV
jgi:hypothetical protein